MILEEQEVIVVKQIARCECGGTFVSTGNCYLFDPAKYPHICDKCEKQETLNIVYPNILFKNKEGLK